MSLKKQIRLHPPRSSGRRPITFLLLLPDRVYISRPVGLVFPLHCTAPTISSSLFAMETVEFKVEMVGIHEKRLRKCLSKLKGVEKVEVDGNSQKVAVTSYAHRNKILKAIRRGGLKAEFWSAQNELLNAYAYATYGGFRFGSFHTFF